MLNLYVWYVSVMIVSIKLSSIYVRRNYGAFIGEATAERIKHEIGSAFHRNETKEIEYVVES